MIRSSLATRVVDRWVGLYTLALPRSVAVERRDEVLSDVWEEQAAGRQSLGVLARAVAGVPADLAWRTRKGLVAPWLKPAARLTLAAVVLFCLAVIQHEIGRHTLIGNAIYASWFAFAFAAVPAATIGAWRRYKK